MPAPARLVEVWAASDDSAGAPGRCGTGWVVTERGVLTAGHVVAPYLAACAEAHPGGAPSSTPVCQLRSAKSSAASSWVNAEVVWHDAVLDVALLVVCDEELPAEWCDARAPGAVVAGVGEQTLQAEAIGFPELAVRPDATRKPEQPPGTLQPAAAERHEHNLMPFDIDSSHPDAAEQWQGISGGAVRERGAGSDSRLVAMVVQADPGHQHRRLYVLALEDLIGAAGFRVAAETVGWDPQVESRSAPMWRTISSNRALGPDGAPTAVEAVSDLGAFGVKAAVADTGASVYPPYLRRTGNDADDALDRALDDALSHGGRRLVLVSGDSAAGKTRSAAEAVRRHAQLRSYTLVAPYRQGGLKALADSGLALERCVLWLDDVDVQLASTSPEVVRAVLDRWPTAVAIATVRAEHLRASGDSKLSDATQELLTDASLVRQVRLAAGLDAAERAEAGALFAESPNLISALDRGTGLGEWLIAGPKLMAYLGNGDELGRPLAETVIGWYRTGLQRPLPADAARTLWLDALDEDTRLLLDDLDEEERQSHFDSAVAWASHPVMQRGVHRQAVIAHRGGGLLANDYVVDRVRRMVVPWPIPEETWALALAHAGDDLESGDDAGMWAVGTAAYDQATLEIAMSAWRTLAGLGDADAMSNLGVLLTDRGEPEDLAEAEQSYRAAADLGHAGAMSNLGVLLTEWGGPEDLAEAEQSYRAAADLGHAGAMSNLGLLLTKWGGPEDLAEAEQCYRAAAELGDVGAMSNLGLLLEGRGRSGDLAEAEQCLRAAAELGSASAMSNLGALLKDQGGAENLMEAEQCYRAAAELGHAGAMSNLAVLLAERGGTENLVEAEQCLRAAAQLGHAGAIFNLGVLLNERAEPEHLAEAEQCYRAAADLGHAGSMSALGLLLTEWGGPEDLAEAEQCYRAAADLGHAGAMFNLALLLIERGGPEDLAEAEQCYRAAAELGDVGAMFNLGLMLKERGGVEDLAEAEQCYRAAAELGDVDAMYNLGGLLARRLPTDALKWWAAAADRGSVAGAINAAVVRAVSCDAGEAQRWLEVAELAGNDAAGEYADVLYGSPKERGVARSRLRSAVELGDTDAMNYLGAAALLEDDPETAQELWERSVVGGDYAAPLLLRLHSKALTGD